MTRVLGFLLPARLYHWLVLRLASLPLAPARKLHRSVVFRHPLHLRDGHYLLVPTEFAPHVLTLPESTAVCLQEDAMEWVDASGWSYALIVANFGAFQETPFLHVHLIRMSEPLAEFWDLQPNWLAVELEEDQQPFRAGRRVIRYNALENTATVHTDIYLD